MKVTMKSALAALLFTFAIAFSAHATTVSECQAIIANLKADTQSVKLTGKFAETKDRPGMLNILNSASLLLDQAKFNDSITKLENFKIKVNDQLKANQINTDPAQGVTAQQLLDEADSAIACIRSLVTQSSGTY